MARETMTISRIVESMPDEKSKNACAAAFRLNEESIKMLSNQKFSEAVETSKEAIDWVKGIPEAVSILALCWAVLGTALWQMGNNAAALEACRAALPGLESEPGYRDDLATCLNVIGIILMTTRNAFGSIGYFERAIKLWSTLPGAAFKAQSAKDNLQIARHWKANSGSSSPGKYVIEFQKPSKKN